MQDRTPTPGQEGRALITPEDGSAPFYAKIQMADNPTEPGTPLNKENLLQDSTAEKYDQTDLDASVTDDIFNKINTRDAYVPNGIVIEKITSSQNWIVPRARDQLFWVYIIGGGGGGCGSSQGGAHQGGGGGGGHIAHGKFTISENTQINIIIGAGGEGTKNGTAGTGGTSSFGELLTAAGGTGGDYNGNGGSGGSGGGASDRGNGGNGSFGGGGGAAFVYGTSPGTGGTGGTYGGDGYRRPKTDGTRVTSFPFVLLLIALSEGVVPSYNGKAGQDTTSGSGGYGGNGGDLYGGGGGYGADGGSSSSGGGGGGGGLFGPGGPGSLGGGGGGGLFGRGGRGDSSGSNVSPKNGGGGNGFACPGADGVCFIVYRKDVENEI